MTKFTEGDLVRVRKDPKASWRFKGYRKGDAKYAGKSGHIVDTHWHPDYPYLVDFGELPNHAFDAASLEPVSASTTYRSR